MYKKSKQKEQPRLVFNDFNEIADLIAKALI